MQLHILDILSKNPSANRKYIADSLSDITPDGVKYHLKKLQTLGYIEFTLNQQEEEHQLTICNIVELSNHYK